VVIPLVPAVTESELRAPHVKAFELHEIVPEEDIPANVDTPVLEEMAPLLVKEEQDTPPKVQLEVAVRVPVIEVVEADKVLKLPPPPRKRPAATVPELVMLFVPLLMGKLQPMAKGEIFIASTPTLSTFKVEVVPHELNLILNLFEN
jgi:hypothetical protein